MEQSVGLFLELLDKRTVPGSSGGSSSGGRSATSDSSQRASHPGKLPLAIVELSAEDGKSLSTTGTLPSPHRYLWCEFRPFAGCSATFALDDSERWIQHHIDHMGARFPSSCLCWYCDYVRFPHTEYQLSREGWFRERMSHIWQHILDGDLSESNMRGDLIMVKHLDKKGVLTERQRSAAYAFCNEIPETLRQYSYSTLMDERARGSSASSKSQSKKVQHPTKKHRHRQALADSTDSSRLPIEKPTDQDKISELDGIDAPFTPFFSRLGEGHADERKSPYTAERHGTSALDGVEEFLHNWRRPTTYTSFQSQLEDAKPMDQDQTSKSSLPVDLTEVSTPNLLSRPGEGYTNKGKNPYIARRHRLNTLEDISEFLPNWGRPTTYTSFQGQLKDASPALCSPLSPRISLNSTDHDSDADEILSNSFDEDDHAPDSNEEYRDNDLDADSPTEMNAEQAAGGNVPAMTSVATGNKPEGNLSISVPTVLSETGNESDSGKQGSSHSELCQEDCSQTPSSTVSAATDQAPITILHRNMLFRQTAVARVRLELLSISREHASSDTGSESGDYDKDTGGSKPDTDGDDRSGSTRTAPDESTTSLRVATEGSVHSNASLLTSGSKADEGGDGGNGNGRKRPRAESPSSATSVCLPRFACPYQVYEKWRNCLRRGPRNPRGGCDGINRLKQHLSRRHMLSKRCQRCWITFSTKRQASEHTAAASCEEKQLSRDERLMTAAQESELESCCGSKMPEEVVWWRLFRHLITEKQDSSLEELKLQYHPFYIGELAMVVPPINLLDLVFSPANAPNLSSGDTVPAWNIPATSSHVPMITDILSNLPDQNLISQTFTVPVYERVPDQDNILEGTSVLPPDFPDDTLYTQFINSSSEPSRHSIQVSPSIPPTSSQETSISSTSNSQINQHVDQPQLRRAYERLQSRFAQVEAENLQIRDRDREIRDSNRQNRTDLEHAVSLLEEILGDSAVRLPSETYDKLERISDMVMGVGRRLS